jgi:hypothetical protein
METGTAVVDDIAADAADEPAAEHQVEELPKEEAVKEEE